MDEHRFDFISRTLAGSLSRRRTLAGLLGVVAASGIAPVAAARATCRRPGASCTRTSQCCDGYCSTASEVEIDRVRRRARRNRCTCDRPRPDACGGACVDTWSDADHCGGCSNVCTDGRECVVGRCINVCDLHDGATGCMTRSNDTTVDVCIDNVYWGLSTWEPCEVDADCSSAGFPPGAVVMCAAGVRIDWPALGEPDYSAAFTWNFDQQVPELTGVCLAVTLPDAQTGLCPV